MRAPVSGDPWPAVSGSLTMRPESPIGTSLLHAEVQKARADGA